MNRFYLSQLVEFLMILWHSKSKSNSTLDILRHKVDSLVTHGFVPSFDYLIEISESIGFIRLVRDSVSLTQLARTFLGSGFSSVYDLTCEKKVS